MGIVFVVSQYEKLPEQEDDESKGERDAEKMSEAGSVETIDNDVISQQLHKSSDDENKTETRYGIKLDLKLPITYVIFQ